MSTNRSDEIAAALHRRIAEQLTAEPVYVINRALLNAQKVRENSRGSARDAVDRWVSLLSNGDLRGIREHMLGDDELSRQMRNSSVFQNVLSSRERDGLVDGVLSAA
ncbi:hypothetical protein DC31_02185 [Microbacterium sp. CH12i]|uniref:hypothetical protein n=1 Tax=Microbacterium sp. CH12i TaxID=1479651 RepID=UPI0004618A0C|nr:hypothetical protein [Microbacterium sp. CH12i]KDA05223.1 hypothetical protein DC31_02185 [Microbacterium sp. CH12i]